MPFTASHAAAVLPFLRTPLPASALVAGSIAPDLPYYLPFPLGWETHSLLSVVSVDLFLGGIAWAVWHGLLAAPAQANAPIAVRTRLIHVELGLRVRLASVRAVLPVVLAVVVGAATHVLWDESTHAGRWGAEHLPALAARWGGRAGHQWAQYASGLLGAVVLVVWLARWFRRTTPAGAGLPPAPRWVWPVLIAVGALAGAAAALLASDLRSAAFDGITRGGAAGLVAALVLSIGWQARHRAGAYR